MLEIKDYELQKICFGPHSIWQDGVLSLNEDELRAYCLEGIAGISIKFEIARPGESIRIVHITDTIMPVWKESGSTFPGWMPGEDLCGEGILHRVSGMTVMQTCQYPGIQEGIVDMAGEGSRYCEFSGLQNLVMNVELESPSYDKEALARDLIQMLVRASEFVGRLTKDKKPDSVIRMEDEEHIEGLPKIGYIYYIQAQGPLRNVHIKGRDCTQMEPEFMSFREIKDGALVSGNYIIACQKNPTYFHQNNPVVEAILKYDAEKLNGVGVILSTESGLLEKKKENASKIARIAKEKGMQGVIITQEGGGHADVDLMYAMEACEKEGIHVVIQTNELAGPTGELPPLVSASPMADAIVSDGNNDEMICLGEVERTIGGAQVLGGKFKAAGRIETSLGILYTATNQLGANCMRTAAL